MQIGLFGTVVFEKRKILARNVALGRDSYTNAASVSQSEHRGNEIISNLPRQLILIFKLRLDSRGCMCSCGRMFRRSGMEFM